MPKNTIAVYTAIFGGKDALLPQKRIPGVDFICFADKRMRASPWDVRVVPSKNADPNRCAKEFKILPHRFLKEYDVSIWIDGNFLVVGDVINLAENVLAENSMAAFDHNETGFDARNCIYKEYESIMAMMAGREALKDDPKKMRCQVERYRKEGYPEEYGLISGGVLVRRHKDSSLIRVMERWWNEIETGSRRDQLSFNYAAWIEQFSYGLIKGDIRRNRWFYMIGIHRKNYRMKILRYRLRRLFGLLQHR